MLPVELGQRIQLNALGVSVKASVGQVIDGLVEVRNQGALIGRRQKAGTPEWCPLGRLGGTQHDEAGEVLGFIAEAIEEPRAETRAGEGLLSGVHLETGPIVIDIVGHHGADDAEVVGTGGKMG